jgi:hypothetical protein
MLEIILQTCLTLFVCSSLGIGTAKLAGLIFSNPVKILFIGMFTVVVLARLWHFLFPVSYWLVLILVSGSLGLIIIFKAEWKVYIKHLANLAAGNWLLVVLPSLCLIYLASLTSISYDDGLYHAQFIRLINRYPEIRGLANLHGRFGFNSNWHLLSAVFNGYGLWSTEANSINCFLVISFILYFCWEGKKRKNYQFAISFIVFPVILIYHFIDPSADLVVILFSFALFIDLLENNFEDAVFWFIALSFLVTVKINAAILCPAILYMGYRSYCSGHLMTRIDLRNVLGFGVLLIVPWLFSNVILSGYLIYPYMKFPLISLPWTVPIDQVGKELTGIKYTPLMRWSGISYDQAFHMSKFAQIQLWWHSLRIVEKSIVSIFVVSGIMGFLLSVLKKNAIAMGILLILLISSIFLVPDLRFFAGFGFAAIFALLVGLRSFQAFVEHRGILLCVLCAQCLLTVVMYIHLFHIVWNNKTEMHLLNPITKGNYHYDKYNKEEKDAVTIYYPVNNQFCWDICPCALEKNENLKLFGDNIRDGFYQIDDVHERISTTYKSQNN